METRRKESNLARERGERGKEERRETPTTPSTLFMPSSAST